MIKVFFQRNIVGISYLFSGAYEGMCSASVVTNLNQSELTTAETEKPGSFSRNLSFSVKRGIKNGQERNNFINRKHSILLFVYLFYENELNFDYLHL